MMKVRQSSLNKKTSTFDGFHFKNVNIFLYLKVTVFIWISIIGVTNAAPRHAKEIFVTIDENCTDFTMELHLPTVRKSIN